MSLSIGFFETLSIVGVTPPYPARVLIAVLSPLRSFNRYGLFSAMTRTRDEISIEVSADGSEWREWPLRYKPPHPPAFIAPHMPRLDWQCWFAALGETSDSPWLANLLYRLLEGSPSVARLLGPNPLGRDVVPLYARAVRYEAAFSPRGDSAWWTRTRKGLFFPVVTLKR